MVCVSPAQLHASSVFGRVEVEFAQVAFFDVVQDVLHNCERRPFALELEDDHAAVVTCTATEHIEICNH